MKVGFESRSLIKVGHELVLPSPGIWKSEATVLSKADGRGLSGASDVGVDEDVVVDVFVVVAALPVLLSVLLSLLLSVLLSLLLPLLSVLLFALSSVLDDDELSAARRLKRS